MIMQRGDSGRSSHRNRRPGRCSAKSGWRKVLHHSSAAIRNLLRISSPTVTGVQVAGTFRPPPLAPLRPFWRPAQPWAHPLMIRWGAYTRRQWPLFATPNQSKKGVHDAYPSAGIESCSVEGGSRGLRERGQIPTSSLIKHAVYYHEGKLHL